MKTKKTSLIRGGALALLALLPLASMASETTGAAKDESSAAQTHVLFTGADIRILYGEKLYPVEDVDGTSLAITVKDAPKGLDVPIDHRHKKLVVNRVLTVTDRSVTVTNFKHEPAYTPASDPARKGTDAMQTSLGMADNARITEDKVLSEPLMVKALDPKTKLETKIANPLLPRMEHRRQIVQGTIGGPLGVAGQAGKKAEEQAREAFDALKVQFELSSQNPIQNAYVVVMANYHTEETPNDSQMWLAARAVGLIDSTRREVWLREGGLPPGYILENVHLHVYERGTEIATDLSENRAALTRDEAHEYLVLDHTSVHEADTVPARIVLAKVPADWATRSKDSSFLKTYYLKVDKTGRPVDVFEDETCETKVTNSYYESILRDQLFLPALEKGKPVDSVVRMKLPKLSS